MVDYKTILGNAVDEFVVEKSKFIGSSFYVNDEKVADEIIKVIKKKYYDATHNCYAYIIGEKSEILKASDDGEPASTAGRPMLDYLLNIGITNCLVVATRYFGGIKLGTGGLVRAYTNTAKISIEKNTIVEKKVYKIIQITFDYNNIGKIQNFIINKGIISAPPQYLQDITIDIYLREDGLEKTKQDLLDLTSANILIEEKEDTYLPFINGEFGKNKL
ncbi:YigZ family protein [Criibacterium bergeronii]|uniref:YigZ family protein n=1 Tax=Criibacterium bergeronii TaxID=1871336 RepID=A0A552VE48_9FIRM|nr:YigZ family protein [Criibacterium bergeronii]TRW28751.1 YigZ family protein [Criibacterium bergeronii]